MHSFKPALLSMSVLAAGLAPATAAHSHFFPDDEFPFESFLEFAVQYMLLSARSVVEFTYDQATVESGSNALVFHGFEFHPDLAWDGGDCHIALDRAVFDGSYSLETVSVSLEVAGVNVPGACFEPENRAMLSRFGYSEIEVESVSIALSYSPPASTANLETQVYIRDAVALKLSAEFDYFRFGPPRPGSDFLRPEGRLGFAQVTIENKGAWTPVEATTPAHHDSVSAFRRTVENMILQSLSENGTISPTAYEHAFVESLSAGLLPLLTEGRPLVITSAPGGTSWLDSAAFENLKNFIAMLHPQVSNTPSETRLMVSSADIAAALAEDANPGDNTLMRLGRAFLTGLGAPRSLDQGADLLLPLARNWSGEAAAMLATAYESAGRDEEAYEMTLIALANSDRNLLAVADKLERRMPTARFLGAQDDVIEHWPGASSFQSELDALTEAGDAAAIRQLASFFAVGRDVPRSYRTAYLLATLAAAAGDIAAASLRDRLDERFAQDGTWQQTAGEAAEEAVQLWFDGGMSAAVIERVQ